MIGEYPVVQVLVFAAALVCVVGLAVGVRKMLQFPARVDLARARAATRGGIRHAFTLGMLPWEKPSRSFPFWVAYVRGIVFHLGAFSGLLVLLASPWLGSVSGTLRVALAVVTGMGVLAGLLGLVQRLIEKELRGLSIPDDYVSLALVVVFLAGATAALMDTTWVGLFWGLSVPMLLYIPFGKIKHCVFFFFSRFYYGEMLGRLGVLEHGKGE